MIRCSILLCVVLSILGCLTVDKSQFIIDRAIDYSGGNLYNENKIYFDFRNFQISVDENNGEFKYERTFEDSTGSHIQILTKQGLTYYIDSILQSPTKKKEESIIESINSQVYFTMLPYKLNDPAVIKEYLGTEFINGKEYHKISVTFQEEGGGVDFEDEFIYWFDLQDYSMDYLAYLFHVNGGGLRFREAVNSRNVKGIVFQDYNNYSPNEKTSLDSLSILFEKGNLKKLSEINIDNIKID